VQPILFSLSFSSNPFHLHFFVHNKKLPSVGMHFFFQKKQLGGGRRGGGVRSIAFFFCKCSAKEGLHFFKTKQQVHFFLLGP
jgi:hypothetical protein